MTAKTNAKTMLDVHERGTAMRLLVICYERRCQIAQNLSNTPQNHVMTFGCNRPATIYDDESAHQESYHDLVKELLKERKIQVEQICPGKSPMSAREVTKLMNEVSEEILRMIEKKPAKAPLTAMADFCRRQV